ncbi:response regulator [Bariatricus sp. HCP28S3_A7]|uniref:response regulator n=1 Tax=Bariatricus sp. HCP28S3_A7 TaxID=3438894 RepID=UPI003F8C2F49
MKEHKLYRKIRSRTVLVFFVCLIGIGGAAYHICQLSAQTQKEQARYTARAASRRIEAQINKYLVVADILKKLVEDGYEIGPDEFQNMSKFMMDDGGVIEGIEYAPDGIVEEVYPEETNRAAIGLNFFENPERKEEAGLAKSSGQYTIAGPFELAQGGTGALILDPIYLDRENRDESFWGFSVLVLNWNTFLEEVGLDKMESSGYHYRIWHTSPNTGEKVIIAKCEDMEMDQAIQVICTVPNDTWYFEIQVGEGWITSGQKFLAGLCTIIISIIIAFGYWQYAFVQYQKKIHNEELEKAAKKARSANEAKTRFLFNMSHDIRTPMNAILGFTEIAEKNVDNPDIVKDSLGKVKVAGKELLDLINEVLNISRIESGTLKPVMEQADLGDLGRTMGLLFEQSMADKGIRLDIENDLRDCKVVCDMKHMREICVNLLANAQKFTPEGGHVLFSVSQKERVEEKSSVYEIRICDNGIGMSEKFQRKQFELFEREEGEEVAGIEGTGLGLPIVKRLVDMLDGEITCHSKKGEGTSYTLRFVLEEAEKEDTCTQDSGIETDRASAEFEGIHALLVEDNELNREIALYMLQEMKFRTDTAENGARAVEKVKASLEDPYDIIFMDVQMPVMNGYEATRAIRNLENHSLAEVPVVAMTANAFEEDKRNAAAAGMNGHIAKPVEIQKLVEAVRQVLQ